MKIKLSRHAKRRIRLYDIPENLIYDLLKGSNIAPKGKQEIIEKVSIFDLPVKIIFDVQDDIINVVTAYPLKKGRKT